MNGSEADEDILDRHLLVIATGTYVDKRWTPLPVADEVKVWKDWLTAEGLAERRFSQLAPELASDPKLKDLMIYLTAEEGEVAGARHDIGPSDALVAVVTGHGTIRQGQHWLVLKKSVEEEADSTMLRTAQLVGSLKNTGVQHALVVIDTCHAGKVTESTLSDTSFPAGWIGIAAAAHTGEARAGAVSEAVRAFLAPGAGDEKYGGPGERFFKASDFVQFIAEHLGKSQDVVPFPRQARGDPSPCLPNPAFVSANYGRVTTESARQEMSLFENELAAHWGPRARGVQRDDEPGSLFTGRATLMKKLIAAATGEPGAFLVTGVAGSGKSAVLARLVTLSDPSFVALHPELVSAIPDEVCPHLRDVDVAIHAQGKTPVEILDRLCQGLKVPLVDASTALGLDEQRRLRLQALRTHLAKHPVTIVIDALDEAPDPLAVVTDVLVPMTDWDNPTVRLIIGVRSVEDVPGDAAATAPRAETLSGHCRILLRARESLRVDIAPYWDDQDLTAYVKSVLLAPAAGRTDTPYTDEPKQVTAAAQRITQLVGTSYLVAQIAARQLAQADIVQALDDPAWGATVSAGLASVLAAELSAAFPDGEDRARALTVLRAASLAFGPGIPWRRIWPTVANALGEGGASYGDADIRWLLGHRIGGYLIRDLDAGITVYRPFHAALGQALTLMLAPSQPATAATSRDETGAEGALVAGSPADSDAFLSAQHRRIADALTALLPARSSDFSIEPDRYLRRHLVEHASASGRLDDLLADVDFLLAADPDVLLPLLTRATVDDKPAILAYRQVAHRFYDQPRSARAQALELSAHWLGAQALVDRLQPILSHREWSVRWAKGRVFGANSVIGRHAGLVLSLAVGKLKDQGVVVSGGEDAIRVWDLRTGAPRRSPVTDARGATSVALGRSGGRPVIVSNYSGLTERDVGTEVFVWDLETGHRVGAPMKSTGPISSLYVSGPPGQERVIALAGFSTVLIWDLETRCPVHHPVTREGYVATAVGVGARGEQSLILTGNWEGQVRVWDLHTGAQVGPTLTGAGNHVTSVRFLDGEKPIVVGESLVAPLHAWFLESGEEPHEEEFLLPPEPAAILDKSDPPMCLTGGTNHRHLWNLAIEATVGGPLVAVREPAVVAAVDGKTVLVSAEGRNILIWDLDMDSSIVEHVAPYSDGPSEVAITARGGRSVVLSSGYDGVVRLWDRDTGVSAGEPLVGRDSFSGVTTLCAADDDRVVAGFGETVMGWDLTTFEPLGEPLTCEGYVYGLATAMRGRGLYGWLRHWVPAVRPPPRLRGRRVAVTAIGKIIQMRDLTTGANIGKPLTGHEKLISDVVVAEWGTNAVIVSGSFDGSVRRWNLQTCASIGNPLRHPHEVQSLAFARAGAAASPLIAAVMSNGAWCLWDLNSEELVAKSVEGVHRASDLSVRRAVALGSPAGHLTLVTGSQDGTVNVWDVARHSGYKLDFNTSVNAVCLFEDYLAVGCDYGLMLLRLHPHR